MHRDTRYAVIPFYAEENKLKRLRYRNGPIDAIDAEILRHLAVEARATMVELGRAVGLSPPSVTERVRRLEEAGVIEGYRAEVSPKALGLILAAHIRVRPMPGQHKTVAALLDAMPAVVECDRTTGEDCYVAKAHLRTVEELEVLIDRLLPYAVTNTAIIQSSPVKRRLPLLPRAADGTP